MRAVTITGTRSTGHRSSDSYRARFADYLAPFAEPTARFYIGGAKGIDSLALLWVASETSARITIAVPSTRDRQPAEARQTFAWCRERIDEVVELGAEELNAAAFHARNRWMVDRSSMVVGFPHGTQPQSGTWQTLNYANEQGKPRLIVPV